MPANLEVNGLDEVLRALDERFSKARVNRIVNSALKNEADSQVEEMKEILNSAYHNTGISADGVTHGNISRSSGYPTIKIGNNGKHWRLIHLNENGYTQNGKRYSGAGNGVLHRYVEAHRKEYAERIIDSMAVLVE